MHFKMTHPPPINIYQKLVVGWHLNALEQNEICKSHFQTVDEQKIRVYLNQPPLRPPRSASTPPEPLPDRDDCSTPPRPCYPANARPVERGNLPGNTWQHLGTTGHTWSHQHLDLRCFYGRISHPASSCSECDTQSLRSLCLETAELQSGGDPSWTGIPPRSIETWKKK